MTEAQAMLAARETAWLKPLAGQGDRARIFLKSFLPDLTFLRGKGGQKSVSLGTDRFRR